MEPAKSVQRKAKLKKISHLVASVIIFLHAYEKHESGHGSYIYFVVAGSIFFSIALFHHPLKSKIPWIDNCFFAIEAGLSFIIAYDYFQMGKTGLPYMYLLAGSFQLAAIYFLSQKLKKQ